MRPSPILLAFALAASPSCDRSPADLTGFDVTLRYASGLALDQMELKLTIGGVDALPPTRLPEQPRALHGREESVIILLPPETAGKVAILRADGLRRGAVVVSGRMAARVVEREVAALSLELGDPAACGDGHVRAGIEGCDDGNVVSGDGCSSTCETELGSSCANAPAGPSDCIPDEAPCDRPLRSCGDGCVDISDDADNCGACGRTCPDAPFGRPLCQQASCGLVCDPGRGDCDGEAQNGCETNLEGSFAHCGQCGASCATGLLCAAGGCVAQCPAGTTECSGACVDTSSDPAHCGTCGSACPWPPNATPTCSSGTCGATCLSGFGDCDGDGANGCETEVASDEASCGACGAACPARMNATAMCERGACGYACLPPYGDCDGDTANGCEQNLDSSVEHCGACGNACPSGMDAPASCTGGVCGLVCRTGYADCDGNVANGCETNLTDDTSHCGACDNACPDLPHVSSAICSSGFCVIGTCDPGWANCDGDHGNGCETDTTSDRDHCGACFSGCGTGTRCVSGACACLPGLTDCDSGTATACRDLERDPSNCGVCGAMCPATRMCSAGVCVCRPGLTECGDACVDTSVDVRHCGACSASCGGGNMCSSGVCFSACPSGTTNCGRSCVPTAAMQSHPLYCGGCGGDGVCDTDEVCRAGVCEPFEVAAGCATCPCDGWCEEECCVYPGASEPLLCLPLGGCP